MVVGLTVSEAAAWADSGRFACSDFHIVARRPPASHWRELPQRLPAHPLLSAALLSIATRGVPPQVDQSRRRPLQTESPAYLPAAALESAVPPSGPPLLHRDSGGGTPPCSPPSRRRLAQTAWNCQFGLGCRAEISMEMELGQLRSARSRACWPRPVNPRQHWGAELRSPCWRTLGRRHRRADLLEVRRLAGPGAAAGSLGQLEASTLNPGLAPTGPEPWHNQLRQAVAVERPHLFDLRPDRSNPATGVRLAQKRGAVANCPNSDLGADLMAPPPKRLKGRRATATTKSPITPGRQFTPIIPVYWSGGRLVGFSGWEPPRPP